MVNSSSLSRVLVIVPLVVFVSLLLWTRPELVAERAEASTNTPVLAYAKIDAAPATTRFVKVTPAAPVQPKPTPQKPKTKKVAAIVTKKVAQSAPAPVATHTAASVGPIAPAHLSIPNASISKAVINVGMNSKGEMDVPSGSTDNVGWYAPGTKPGAIGVAVMDAHVYAAFKNLAKVWVGDDIYVADASGAELHFRVTKVATYALASLSSSTLFSGVGTSGRYLNLITCAGTYDASAGTYDHRLIVFAELVD